MSSIGANIHGNPILIAPIRNYSLLIDNYSLKKLNRIITLNNAPAPLSFPDLIGESKSTALPLNSFVPSAIPFSLPPQNKNRMDVRPYVPTLFSGHGSCAMARCSAPCGYKV